MRTRLFLSAVSAVAAVATGQIPVSAPTSQAQEFCSDWFIVGDVCEAVDYCWKTDDPACDQPGHESGQQP
jgi:hypothetical protein